MPKIHTTIISVGGSMIIPHEIDVDFLRELKRIIDAYVKQGKRRVVLVAGGGAVCRQYQAAARKLVNAPDKDQDWIGIMATRLNGELLRVLFGGNAYAKVQYDRKRISTTKRIIIGSGYKPGQSSDMEAVAQAKLYHADRVINISNIKYVYNKDPKRYKNARPILSMNWAEFLRMFDTAWMPGLNTPFDPVAAKEAKKIGLDVVIMSGDHMGHLEACLNGKSFDGTVISDKGGL